MNISRSLYTLGNMLPETCCCCPVLMYLESFHVARDRQQVAQNRTPFTTILQGTSNVGTPNVGHHCTCAVYMHCINIMRKG